jgi:uncharacterized protein YerC
MPHISGKKLKDETLRELYSQLIVVLEKGSGRKGIRPVLNDLFTRTEKIMLAKRLAVIVLLARGVPVHKVANSLAMSPSTVNRMSAQLEMGRYQNISAIFSKNVGKKVVDLIEEILYILPPKAGRGRWRNLYKN